MTNIELYNRIKCAMLGDLGACSDCKKCGTTPLSVVNNLLTQLANTLSIEANMYDKK